MKAIGNEVFRFSVMRDVPTNENELGGEAEVSAEQITNIETIADSDLISEIRKELEVSKIIEMSVDFIESDDYIKTESPMGQKLIQIMQSIDKECPKNGEELTNVVNEVIDDQLPEYIEKDEFKQSCSNIVSSIAASLISYKTLKECLPFLIRSAQLCLLLKEVASDVGKFKDQKSIRSSYFRKITFPSDLVTLSKITRNVADENEKHEREMEKGQDHPEAPSGDEQVSFKDSYIAYNLIRNIAAHDIKIQSVEEEEKPEADKIAVFEKRTIAPKSFVGRIIRKLFFPSFNLDIAVPDTEHAPEPRLVLSDKFIDKIPETIINELNKLEIDPSKSSISDVARSIKQIALNRYKLMLRAKSKSASKIQQTWNFMAPTWGILSGEMNWMEVPGIGGSNGDPDPGGNGGGPTDPQSPLSYPSVKLLGINDLIVTREEKVKYEAAEIAHIENVLEGEAHSRKHRRLNRTEEFFAQVTETISESVQDLQTTEKFELQKEVNEVFARQQHLETGLKISASYGPTVSAEANFGYQSDSSIERSTKTASNFSRETTERAVERIKERIQTTRETRTIAEVEETNTHGINNPPNSGNLSGVYQYVDKTYEMRMYNYGKRVMIEFIVPEPGSYLRHLRSSVSNFTPPEPFNITIEDIDELSYTDFSAKWQVSEIEPPPDEYVVVPYSVKLKTDSTWEANHAGRVKIPDGYEALYAVAAIHAGARSSAWSSPSANSPSYAEYTRLTLSGFYFKNIDWSGRHYWPRSFEGFPVAQDLRTGELPLTIGLVGDDGTSINVGIAILCVPTEAHKMKWKISTYAALQAGYQNLLSEFEEKLSAASIAEGVSIQGDNPANNRVREKSELKRSCIELMRRNYLGTIDLMTTPILNISRIDFGNLETQIPPMQYFESVFEWENIVYDLYPYYWAGVEKWDGMNSEDDPDPLHKKFLQSGAARVVVPVRPGEEGRALYYLDFNDFWEDENIQPPHLPEREPLIAIMQKFYQDLDLQPSGVPFGDAWLSRVPTSLVTLREQNGLPNDWIDLIPTNS